MEYATATHTQSGMVAQNATKLVPELGRLKAASERIAMARCKIDNFIDRFNGQPPEAANASNGNTVSDNYRNDLDSIFGQLDRLEAAVSALDHIG